MIRFTTILCGLLAMPHVLGYKLHLGSDGKFRKGNGGIDPGQLKRHVYTVSEWCTDEPIVMTFGDEIIIQSQRPDAGGYKTNTHCNMTIKTDKPEDVGIIIRVLSEDTPNCEDYLKIEPAVSPSLQYCGNKANVTNFSDNYMNETIHMTWHVPQRDKPLEESSGFRVLFTAYQTECIPGQPCFPCSNGLIVDQVHMCNGYDNCGDASDEQRCTPSSPLPHTETSTSQISTGIMLLVMAIAVLVFGYLSAKFYRERNQERDRNNCNRGEGDALVAGRGQVGESST